MRHALKSTSYRALLPAVLAIWWGTPAFRAAVTRQVWTNIPGSSLHALVQCPRFPARPDKTETVDRLATPEDWGDNYGQRLAGYLVPPKTGEYTFWIAGDDACVLRLSTDDSPAHLADVAQVTGYTAPVPRSDVPCTSTARTPPLNCRR